MEFHVISLGCPKNRVDSERYSWVFESAGWKQTDTPETADLILLNTCAFIAPATEESLEHLNELIDWKAGSENRKLVLAGCLPGRYPDDGSGGLQDIDLILGPEDWRKLSSWLGASFRGEALVSGSGPVRFLKIAEGCSNRCAYCTIPSIRGGFTAVSPENIQREAALLADQGAIEIGLVAQDSGNWFWKGMDLTDIAERLASKHPDIRFRLYYLHPGHFPGRLIDLLHRRRNIMPYIDMPIQHASTQVLHRMGRGYGEKELRRIMDELEESTLEIAVRYTIITGYPGETDEDFHVLRNFLSDYSCGRHIAAFTWYPEEGTTEYARTIKKQDSIHPGVASERLAMLSSVGDSLYAGWDERLSGRIIDVVSDDAETGHTVWDAPEVDAVTVFTRPVSPGRIIRVRVVDSSGAVLMAEPLND